MSHLIDNVGRGGLARTVVVGLAMVAIAVARLIDGGQWLPLAALAVGVAAPLAGARRLVVHLERTLRLLRYTSYAIVGATVVLGVLRDRLPVDERIWLGMLVGVVVAYLTAFTVVFSDPEVVRR